MRTLHAHGVRFVVIGGFAALAHGSPFPTEDINITPQASTDNFRRLSAALGALDARTRTSSTDGGLPFAHDAASLAAVATWNLVTRHGDLDISITPSGTAGYPDISRDAVQIEAFASPPATLLWPTSSAASRPPTARKTSGCCRPCASCWPNGIRKDTLTGAGHRTGRARPGGADLPEATAAG